MSADLIQQLEALRPSLLRFAQLQLRNPVWAEDVVQDTLVAVIERPQNFAGRSALKTWVIGILKHKLIDLLRSRSREVQIDVEPDENQDDAFDALFAADGHWASPPSAWGDPEATLARSDFFRVLELCVEKLPTQTGRVFMMREWLELDTEEICKELGISTTNCWVILSRARMRLRECLELNWFGEKAAS
ncbi:MAG: sigma-70 family RNA polymerase sigma factor [Burkholderiaceae bacterium]|nr:MAG: sigma-70 family RNA polymerase sigma factor [Burkholderiaceae bacterium]